MEVVMNETCAANKLEHLLFAVKPATAKRHSSVIHTWGLGSEVANEA